MFYTYIGDSASIEDCIKMYSDSYRRGDINHPSVAEEISKVQSGKSYQRQTINIRTPERSEVELPIPECSGVDSEEISNSEQNISTRNMMFNMIPWIHFHKL